MDTSADRRRPQGTPRTPGPPRRRPAAEHRVPPAPLHWIPHGEQHTATAPVPGSSTRLEARLRPEPLPEQELPGFDAPLWPGPPAVPRAPWHWEIGWSLPDGEFITEASAAKRTLAAAVFAAEQTIVEYQAAAPAVRQRWTGRLLVPRSPGLLSAADPALMVVTLLDVLWAVLREDFGNKASTRGLLASLYAALRVPVPQAGEPGAGGRIGESAFDSFLAVHAVVLTPPARAYLDGVVAAALEGGRVREHHAAGLRAALSGTSDEHAQRLVAELGPLPSGQAWIDLYDDEGLERFLDHDHGAT
ncbi:hypothetical protein [Streptomyces sp. NPDC051183]|uniref:hypothetical protein n=1 Tax=Streptomyces sp. NPDC051183 TaxID=3155165 RepID=UPI0034396C82